MKNTQDPNGMMREMIALSVVVLTLGLVIAINLSRMFYAATPESAPSDYGYFGDPAIDPAFATRSQPAHKPVEDQE